MDMGNQIRVVIADDHRLFREGLRLILSREASIETVGEAANSLQTIDLVSDLKPDVLLLSINMPSMDGIEVIMPLKEKSPATKPLVLTAAVDDALIFQALKAGAKGYLSKDASVFDLFKAIQVVYRGDLWVERKLIARFFEEEASAAFKGGGRRGRTQEGLTLREREILRLLASGCANKDIAQSLFISEKTVKSHLNSIFRKLHVTGRLQAVLYAIHRGLS